MSTAKPQQIAHELKVVATDVVFSVPHQLPVAPVLGVNAHAVHKCLAKHQGALDSLKMITEAAAATSIQARARSLPHRRWLHKHKQETKLQQGADTSPGSLVKHGAPS